jgi:hypothetical protein
MNRKFYTDLIRLVHSNNLHRLMLKAEKDERYEDAAIVRDEIERRVELGFMRKLEDGTAIALEVDQAAIQQYYKDHGI